MLVKLLFYVIIVNLFVAKVFADGCIESLVGQCGSAGGCTGQYGMCTYYPDRVDKYSCTSYTLACDKSSSENRDVTLGGSTSGFSLSFYSGPKIDNFLNLLTPVVKILYYLGLSLGLIFIVYSGYLFMTSEGNPDQVQNAKDHLTSAIAGTLFILLSVGILRVIISQILGVDFGM